MQRTIGYFGMGLLGALIALGGHELMHRDTLQEPRASALAAPVVRYVNMAGATNMSDKDFTFAAENTVNAVVHVTTETAVNVRDPFADFFWGYRAPQQQQLRQGAGSGVIVTQDGYIVTNNHVVDGADRIRVHLNDNRMFDGKVIGRDPSTDLALLKIDAVDLATVPYGNSDDVRVGEWVLAVGNPMNLTSTVTAGIVSAKARNINLLQYDASRDIFPIESFIQTDAAVNPGNSGGALVNTNGELVGINTAIASSTGQYAGYSFAVPVNIVQKVAKDLLEFGSVQRAYIGVSIRDMDQALADETRTGRIRGVYVNGLTDGGAAQKAGMRPGDVIIKVGSIEVNNVTQLQEQVGKFRPGNRVPVTILREGEEQVFDMTLRGREGTTVAAVETKTPVSKALGAEFQMASPEELRALRLEHGVKVTTINAGILRSSGIREGFIITSVDQVLVKDPAQLERILASKRGGVLVEGVYPNGTRAYYGLGL
ncbi:MAG: trypsin-like peptidase domain-containing protein [Flavobacteriales bacterium]|nr:trypsin-like peptidase domain-containing protein [Flavobacteriales bacterium]